MLITGWHSKYIQATVGGLQRALRTYALLCKCCSSCMYVLLYAHWRVCWNNIIQEKRLRRANKNTEYSRYYSIVKFCLFLKQLSGEPHERPWLAVTSMEGVLWWPWWGRWNAELPCYGYRTNTPSRPSDPQSILEIQQST